ncbi:MAG: methyltransferase domain-containing protein [Azoarcus sp.]|nr:methyltransferase domain-containing protein [Azoarcus sp.]
MTAALSRKREIRRAFERAAPAYDRAARVQREAAARLLDFALTQPRPAGVRRILDAGCGTGQALPGLMARFPRAHCIAADFSAAMLAHARAFDAAPLCADIEHLPLADAAVDLYWSSLALQWCTPATALAEAARVLTPGGTAWIATLGPRTLHELRAAFAAVDDAAHVIDFANAGHWLDDARAAGFSILSSARTPLCDLAADLRTLLGNIKAIGARTVGEKRRKTPLGRHGWQTLQSAYEAFRRPDGVLPATYDLILLALRKSP